MSAEERLARFDVDASQFKIYSLGYIGQCAAEPSCPVRGVMGYKRCSSSSSASCVG